MYMIEARNGSNIYTVYDDRFTDDRYAAFNPKLNFEDNAAGSLSFAIPQTNNTYGLDGQGNYILRRMTTDIYVRKYDRNTGKNPIIWGGRIISDDYDFYNNRLISCEGSLAFLNDVDTYGNMMNASIVMIFASKIREYNKMFSSLNLSSNRMIWLRVNGYGDGGEQYGIIDPTHSQAASPYDWTSDDITVVDISPTYTGTPTVWGTGDNASFMEWFMSCVSNAGGHMYLEYEEDPITKEVRRYLHWESTDTLPTVSQQIVFGENLLDYSSNYDSSNFYTVALPLGCQLNNEDNLDPRYPSDPSDPNYTGIHYLQWSGKYQGKEYLQLTYTVMDRYKTDTNPNPTYAKLWPPDDPTDWDPQMLQIDGELYPYVLGVKMDLNDPTQPATPIEYLYQTQGWRCAVLKYTDVTDTKILLEKAKAFLRSAQFNDLTISVSAADLVDLGVPIADGEDPFQFLSMVRVLSIPHGLNQDFLIDSMEIDMADPGNNRISLSIAEKTHYPRSLSELVAQDMESLNHNIYTAGQDKSGRQIT